MSKRLQSPIRFRQAFLERNHLKQTKNVLYVKQRYVKINQEKSDTPIKSIFQKVRALANSSKLNQPNFMYNDPGMAERYMEVICGKNDGDKLDLSKKIEENLGCMGEIIEPKPKDDLFYTNRIIKTQQIETESESSARGERRYEYYFLD
ncbi:hypothetical protein Bhyg_09618 [Pseudolycoriella hygida]|uniref:Uncharacterized protein n=1 Tax=Pseudolycoriella hygida TaxID=35572 RepID=A0A9Q0N8P7_9DIPT|nr:hypothetical protein Bhyg_09618 [Pseudolycoriella hygida]